MAEPFCAVINELRGVIGSLKLVLKGACEVEDITTDPTVREMVRVWTQTMQGRSLKEAVALLFAGTVALKGEWEEAMKESDAEHLLAYATVPEIKVN